MRILTGFILVVLSGGCYSQPCAEESQAEDTTGVSLVRLKINSNENDYCPVVQNDRIYFVSGRNNVAGVEYRDAENNTGITDIYMASVKNFTATGKCISLPPVINSKYYEGPFGFSKDGQQLLFTKSEALGKTAIYQSTRSGNHWGKPEKLVFCNDSFSYCHPAFSKNNDTLWFSSNLRGGAGGMDLYYSILSDQKYQEPVNAGAPVNSGGQDVFPFVASDGSLYFSSDRPGGTGNLDLYALRPDSFRMKVKPLPAPFNSGEDDFGIWLDSSQASGYFSSARVPKHKDDIYYFTRSVPDFSGALFFPVKKRFCYSFFEESAADLSDTLITEFEWDFGDGSKERGIKTRHCYSAPGRYFVQLNTVQKVSGEVFQSQASHTLSIDTLPAIKIVSEDALKIADCLKVSYVTEGFGSFQIQKAWWSFGDGIYNTGNNLAHRYKKPGAYTMEVYLLLKDITDNSSKRYRTKKTIEVN